MVGRTAVNLCLLLLVLSFASGCSVNRATATLDPTTDLASIKSLYVVKFEPDERDLHLLIADKLKSIGYEAGTDMEAKAAADTFVTYVDKWMWDITNYMLELTIVLRDPKTDYPLASGNSFHTSLSRKSPEEMVSEVIDNIFKQGDSGVKN